jgi:hypothetical protein
MNNVVENNGMGFIDVVENPRKLTPVPQRNLTPVGHFKLTP